MPKRKRRGSGLATVLMVSTLLVVVAFTVVGLGFNHLSVSSRLSNSLEARNLAEAAVAQALQEMQVDEKFGTSGYTGPKSDACNVTVSFPGMQQGASGFATFDAATATARGVPLSLNNFRKPPAAGYQGKMVPGDAVQVIGVGSCNGVNRTVEAVVYIPPFPYSVASSGPIQSDGGFKVAAVNAEADLGDPTKLTKGNLLTNSGIGGDAVKLNGNGNNVTGDVRSHSGATLGTTILGGQQQLNMAPVNLPKIDLSAMGPLDTYGKANLTNLSSSTGPTSAISGFNRYSQADHGPTLTFDTLNLNNGVLFVDGNLQVNHGITGNGAVIVTGQTTVLGGGQLAGTQAMALLSKGKMSISGDSGNPSVIKGLMYSEGGLNSDEMKLRGMFVNNEASSTPNGTNMTNTELTQISSMGNVSFPVTSGGQRNVFPPGGEYSAWGAAPTDTKTLTISSGSLSGVSISYTLPMKWNKPDYSAFIDGSNYVGKYTEVSGPNAGVELNVIATAPGSQPANGHGYNVQWSDLNVTVPVGSPIQGDSDWVTPFKQYIRGQLQAQRPGATSADLDFWSDYAVKQVLGSGETHTGAVGGTPEQAYTAKAVAIAVFNMNAAWHSTGITPGTDTGAAVTEQWHINLSDFVSRAESMRILYWREL